MQNGHIIGPLLQTLFDRLERDREPFTKKLREMSERKLTALLKDLAAQREEGFAYIALARSVVPPENPTLEELRKEIEMCSFDQAVAIFREMHRRRQSHLV